MVVVPIAGVCGEVLDGLWGMLREEEEVDVAEGGVNYAGGWQVIFLGLY